MVWTYFIGERLGPLIICDKEGIKVNECEYILYNGLFSLINNLLKLLKDLNTI